MSLRTKLRDRRRLLGLTQEAVAERAGLHRPHIQAIEAGKTDPVGATLEKLVNAMDAELLVIPRSHVSAVLALIGEKPAADDPEVGSTFDDVFIPDPTEK